VHPPSVRPPHHCRCSSLYAKRPQNGPAPLSPSVWCWWSGSLLPVVLAGRGWPRCEQALPQRAILRQPPRAAGAQGWGGLLAHWALVPMCTYDMNRGPDLPSGGITIDLVEMSQNDPASNQHDSNPAIAAPLLLWLSTMHCTIDVAMRAFPCL
jgi:hypothetical protein